MRVHVDEPLTVYLECELSLLASGLIIELILLLLLLLTSSLIVSFLLAGHLLLLIYSNQIPFGTTRIALNYHVI